MLQEYVFDDRCQSGRRCPRLFLARGPEVREFEGQTIDGWCAIAGHVYEPCGWRSGTRWTLLLAPGVRPIYLLSPLHGVWGQTYHSWDQVALDLRLPLDVAQPIVRKYYKSTATRLDKVADMVSRYEGVGSAASPADPTEGWEDVAIFILPRLAHAQGRYFAPRTAWTYRGAEVRIEPGRIGSGLTWEEPVVIPSHAEVLRNCSDGVGGEGSRQRVIEVRAAR